MYRKILVPVDGSEPSNLGLAEAVKLAKALGARINLLHVVNEFVLVDPYGSYAGDIVEILRKSGQEILKKAEQTVREQGLVPEATMVDHIGRLAADLIIARAKEWGADLIVMGTHGRRGIRRLALGSDAEQVVRTSPVPVLLVRNPGTPGH